MGLYDRDYFREDSHSSERFGRSFSAVAVIIALNVALYLVDQLLGGSLFSVICLKGGDATSPLNWYHCLTYGFAHDPTGFMHIFCNMLTLFFFGPVIERLYGKLEFLVFYLCSIIFGGVVWCVLHSGSESSVLGASGGITAVVILFAFRYPKSIIYIWGIIPFPAWLAGVLYVAYDAFGAHSGMDNIGHDVHLAGAAFAAFYFLSGVCFTKIFVRSNRSKASSSFDSSVRQRTGTSSLFSRKQNTKQWDKESLEEEVDRILAKYSKYGKSSLTKEEENTLRFASKEFQKWQK